MILIKIGIFRIVINFMDPIYFIVLLNWLILFILQVHIIHLGCLNQATITITNYNILLWIISLQNINCLMMNWCQLLISLLNDLLIWVWLESLCLIWYLVVLVKLNGVVCGTNDYIAG